VNRAGPEKTAKKISTNANPTPVKITAIALTKSMDSNACVTMDSRDLGVNTQSMIVQLILAKMEELA
jgi:hypothetical protein